MEKKYKEAAQYATIMGLQTSFGEPEILLLPLIIQDKISVVENFVADHPTMQKNLVKYLDGLIGMGKNMSQTLEQYIEYVVFAVFLLSLKYRLDHKNLPLGSLLYGRYLTQRLAGITIYRT